MADLSSLSLLPPLFCFISLRATLCTEPVLGHGDCRNYKKKSPPGSFEGCPRVSRQLQLPPSPSSSPISCEANTEFCRQQKEPPYVFFAHNFAIFLALLLLLLPPFLRSHFTQRQETHITLPKKKKIIHNHPPHPTCPSPPSTPLSLSLSLVGEVSIFLF